jgi:2-iminobutanoate/2-iminopropanoate deaminase
MTAAWTDEAPPPGGHYSQAVVHGDVVYVSGQLPIEPGSGRHLDDEPIELQVKQALANLAAILRASGSDVDHVLKVTVYVADIGLWARVNAVYAEFFGAHRPARAVVPTGPLHFGLQVEIDAIAARKDATLA